MKRYALFAMLLFLAITTLACTRSADRLPEADKAAPPAEAAPEAPATTMGAGAEPAAEPDAHIAAEKLSGGSVTPQATSGNVEVLPVESDFDCTDRNQCTSTKYSNSPKSDSECECAAACTPYVVNKAEADRREAANKRLCDTEDWYGDQCPAPECGFVEFESFSCVGGKCVGMAVGK